MGATLRLLAAATASVWTPCGGDGASCTSDLGCSLNGVCTDGRCACDAAWGGESGRCDELQFEPVSFPQGYGLSPPLNSSWGGNPVWDDATRKYHLYTSVLTNGCFLGAHFTPTPPSHPLTLRPGRRRVDISLADRPLGQRLAREALHLPGRRDQHPGHQPADRHAARQQLRDFLQRVRRRTE